MLAKKIFSTGLLFLSILSFSQSFTIKGKVVDKKNNPLEYAMISLLNPDTFDEVAGGVTDAKGSFSIEAAAGDYLIHIESLSGSSTEKPLHITKNEDFGVFVIEEAVVELKGADLSGKSAPLYRMELDKKVYDVAKDPLNKGRSLSEALENVPSVQVEGDGTVSLRGNENVRILIDGKPSALIGTTDPAQALKNLPADIVERIEVVTNPSARYEAEGSGGIINIILKKGKLKGMNGAVIVSGGYPTTAGIAANLNYRTGKWNHFTNVGFRHSNRVRESSTKTTRYDANGIPSFEDMDGESREENNDFNFMLGTEYFLDAKNTFSISGTIRKARGFDNSVLNYFDFDSNMNQTAASVRTQDENQENADFEGNFNYKHDFNDKGHEFMVNVRANYSDESSDAEMKEIGNLVNSNERSFNSDYKNSTMITADYVYPFGEKSKLEMGARGDFNGIYTNFKVDSLTTSGWEPKEDFSTRTNFSENIYATYVQFGQGFGQFSYFAGVRMEGSDIIVRSYIDNTELEKKYVDFFPSLFLTYELENTDQLQVSYSRRIRRPRGWLLIPMTSYSDNRNLRMGNPDLDPQYTDAYEMSYITKIGDLMLTPNLFYQMTHDNIQRIQTMNENGVLTSKPINVGTEERYGGDLTFTYKPVRWWSLMGNLNLFGYRTRGEYTETHTDPVTGVITSNTTSFAGDGFSWFGRAINTFNLPSKFVLQLTGMYRAAVKNAHNTRKPMYGLDLSLSKDLFNDNATLTMNVRDVFNSRAFESSNFGENFVTDNVFRWNVRSINIAFAYRFNQSKREQRKNQQNNNNNEGGGDLEMGGGGIRN